MEFVIHPNFVHQAKSIESCVANFKVQGEILGEASRNCIKIFEVDGQRINIKSFKVPAIVNRIIYSLFRKSKARRSYEYAMILQEKGIGTPQPIAYFENSPLFLKDSYYISEHLMADLTFRELTTDFNYPDHEVILRQFMAFTFKLHENGIEFLDNTPGNTLIKKIGTGQYDFFLVDLNRMKFHGSMTFEQRIINMSKLTKEVSLLKVMSDEYAKLCGKTYDDVYLLLSQNTNAFQNRLARKKQLKRQFAFGTKKTQN
ncbi:MAG TPA: Kdo domain containing protein [Flavobacterium sp.]|jgi:hypothetical protein